MIRYCFILLVLVVLFSANNAYCGWEELFIVNDTLTDKQSPRGDDCPWSIAADDDGNVYAVWEDNRSGYLNIYFRKKSYDGTWDQSDKIISNEPNWTIPSLKMSGEKKDI